MVSALSTRHPQSMRKARVSCIAQEISLDNLSNNFFTRQFFLLLCDHDRELLNFTETENMLVKKFT